MNSSFTPVIFLAVVLLAGIILLAVVAGPNQRSRGRRGPSRSGGGGYRSSAPSVPRMDRAQVADRWATIQAMAAGGGNGLRQAVSEADKLFDHAMRQQGLPGVTMGDRLKAARSRFNDYGSYDAVWRAHKLRNALAHEVGFDLVPSQAREALTDFERGLRQLGVL